MDMKVDAPVHVSHPMIPTASGARAMVSAESDWSAGNETPSFFLMSP